MFARCDSDIFSDGEGFWESSLTSALNYPGMLLDCLEDTKQHLVKNDVILSEGVGDPIPKQEHSYSCSIASDGDSVPSSPVSLDMQDDMESECFPCIPMKKASQDSLFLKGLDQSMYIKSEPLSPSPPPLIKNTYTTSTSSPSFNNNIKQEPDSPVVQVKQESVSFVSKSCQQQQQSLLKTSPITTRIICPKVSLKVDDSCNISNVSSISAVTTSAGTGSSSVLVSRQRILPAVRQAISSPLISTQLKGSSGVIYLTEEEKRTLISEGYPIPTKLPLSKAEERSLKKIRRKIKNKISAQESRRKKKEYMDSLERKYDLMQNEANVWRSKAEALQAKNAALVKQVADLEDQLRQAEKGGEITYIVPVHRSIDIHSESNQEKTEVTEFQDITSNCIDIDVD